MTQIIIKILIEILCTLSLATKHVKEGRLSELMIFPVSILVDLTYGREIWKEVAWR
jgi:hypothetical protein